MVHGFAEQSRGRLILHSQKGKGTTAELRLPVNRSLDDGNNHHPRACAGEGASP
jgi:hypothetical protein